jgi:hypothetical protein
MHDTLRAKYRIMRTDFQPDLFAPASRIPAKSA